MSVHSMYMFMACQMCMYCHKHVHTMSVHGIDMYMTQYVHTMSVRVYDMFVIFLVGTDMATLLSNIQTCQLHACHLA